ncbi:hypothetical protein [Kitasatospora sp. NPDC001527]|uniref:hypothetical protein n=1 Tax=Kitasatospora sp. NPDC001527 TaxID=3154519 RepID=UPI003319828A
MEIPAALGGSVEETVGQKFRVITDRKALSVIVDGPEAISSRMVRRGAHGIDHICDGERFVDPGGRAATVCGCPSAWEARRVAAMVGLPSELRVSYRRLVMAPEAVAPCGEQWAAWSARSAADLTNREIGERPFLSPCMVSTHLRQRFPKLGAASRGALRDAHDRKEAPGVGRTTSSDGSDRPRSVPTVWLAHRCRPTVMSSAQTGEPEVGGRIGPGTGATPRAHPVAVELIDRTLARPDGYTARDLLAHPGCTSLLSAHQHDRLIRQITACGLGEGTLPDPPREELETALDTTEKIIDDLAGG